MQHQVKIIEFTLDISLLDVPTPFMIILYRKM